MRRGRLGLLALLAAALLVIAGGLFGPPLVYGYLGAGNRIALPPADPRYWLLIGGTPVETMPRLAEIEDSLVFFYSARDGTAPETRGLRYASLASAERAIDFYRRACLNGDFGSGGRVGGQVGGSGPRSLSCRNETGVGAVDVSGSGDAVWITVRIATP